MSIKSREVIWGGRIMGADIRAEGAREAARRAVQEADLAEAKRVVDLHGGLSSTCAAGADNCAMPRRRPGWLEVECDRCKTRASLPLDAIRRPRDTPIWKLEASLKCRSCRKGR